jgi:hypothetical protein
MAAALELLCALRNNVEEIIALNQLLPDTAKTDQADQTYAASILASDLSVLTKKATWMIHGPP